MKAFLSFVIVVILLVLPTFVVVVFPQHYNTLAQILFDLLLFVASLWFAVTISTREAEKRATDKWLPAAETACNELLTMISSIERMRSKHISSCDSIELIFPNVSSEQLAPVVQFMKVRCRECAASFETLGNHIDNSFRNWEVFIDTNCTESECRRIHTRLEERKTKLGLSVQESTSATPQESTSQEDKINS